MLSLERQNELDTALMEAANMAEVVSGWMGQALGFENGGPVTLSSDERSQIYWAINFLTHLITGADRIFRGPEELIAPTGRSDDVPA